jgi:hypothetical protein
MTREQLEEMEYLPFFEYIRPKDEKGCAMFQIYGKSIREQIKSHKKVGHKTGLLMYMECVKHTSPKGNGMPIVTYEAKMLPWTYELGLYG